MANSFFNFRQFTVHQDKSAMKVCTDSCLFGAWMASQTDIPKDTGMLDIGTGSGLLSLMMAQQHDNPILGIEIDEAAAIQANQNVQLTPWKDRIRILNADVMQFQTVEKFGFIFSNPPFYENSLTSAKLQKNIAHHDEALTLKPLLEFISGNLNETGKASLLLPYSRLETFSTLAEDLGFNLLKILKVKQTPEHDFFRACIYFGKTAAMPTVIEEMYIKSASGIYSDSFCGLLNDYYLW
ncbi:MAG: methyltransferase [Sphingobacteriales bacterium]|nr:methyltransferase [Sphingobacteriales bacterium]